jgi:mRNA interferase RelE/StbE
MKYAIVFKPRALKDLKTIPKRDVDRILNALEEMENGLNGDVKRLAKFTPEYRLRVGRFRVLFEIEDSAKIVVYRIAHRREAYR